MSKSLHKKPIRSFIRRERRLTIDQKKAFDEYWAKVGLTVSDGWLDVEKIFGRVSEVVLEIGFGMGDSLLAMAKAHPEKNFIGVEVHRRGVAALLSLMGQVGISNIRVYQEDAISVLNECIKDDSLSGTNIFFPDPWPKKRHHKRRLIQPAFIALIHQKLKLGGQLHLATDWEDYAIQMMRVLSTTKGFQNVAGEGKFVKNQYLRPVTKFEKRGEQLGHVIWDLVFKRLSTMPF